MFPDPGEDPPFSLLDLLWVPEIDTLGAPPLGTAAPAGPGGWEEDPVSVGTEYPVVFCVALTISVTG